MEQQKRHKHKLIKARKMKANRHAEILTISESALKKDWNFPREDRAWQNL